jgi:hypothetical protein
MATSFEKLLTRARDRDPDAIRELVRAAAFQKDRRKFELAMETIEEILSNPKPPAKPAKERNHESSN